MYAHRFLPCIEATVSEPVYPHLTAVSLVSVLITFTRLCYGDLERASTGQNTRYTVQG